MAAPRRYPDELRERATRLAVEARQGPGINPLVALEKEKNIAVEEKVVWVPNDSDNTKGLWKVLDESFTHVLADERKLEAHRVEVNRMLAGTADRNNRKKTSSVAAL